MRCNNLSESAETCACVIAGNAEHKASARAGMSHDRPNRAGRNERVRREIHIIGISQKNSWRQRLRMSCGGSDSFRIWMACQNSKSAVDLLREQHPGKFMRHGKGGK